MIHKKKKVINPSALAMRLAWSPNGGGYAKSSTSLPASLSSLAGMPSDSGSGA